MTSPRRLLLLAVSSIALVAALPAHVMAQDAAPTAVAPGGIAPSDPWPQANSDVPADQTVFAGLRTELSIQVATVDDALVVVGRRTHGDDAPPSGDATRRPPSAFRRARKAVHARQCACLGIGATAARGT